VFVRVTSWIVPFVQKNKDDPRSSHDQHEPNYFRLALDMTFEADPSTDMKSVVSPSVANALVVEGCKHNCDNCEKGPGSNADPKGEVPGG